MTKTAGRELSILFLEFNFSRLRVIVQRFGKPIKQDTSSTLHLVFEINKILESQLYMANPITIG